MTAVLAAAGLGKRYGRRRWALTASDGTGAGWISCASAAGSQSSTVVPAPRRLVMRIAPSDCAARPCTIDSPSPVPLPTPLVVKNGSAARFSVCSSIPTPVSDTEMQT